MGERRWNPTPKTAVWVGIFFTVGLVALLGLSLIVSEARFGAATYNLAAYFKEGQGLEIGSNVTLRGVPIGTWCAKSPLIRAARKASALRILLEIEDRYRLPVDSVASVRFQSLLGQNFVYVLDGDSAQTPSPTKRSRPKKARTCRK
jgi:phospholipid/cholesterol/gamma-HCH transport system substrate-binding protein